MLDELYNSHEFNIDIFSYSNSMKLGTRYGAFTFNSRNGGNPLIVRNELRDLIVTYRNSRFEMFRDFASLLEKFEDPIINSFIMVEKIGNGRIYDARLSNGPIESINRKVKDLKRMGRDFRNFEHFRNRFLFATRSAPILNGSNDYNPATYYEDDDF